MPKKSPGKKPNPAFANTSSTTKKFLYKRATYLVEPHAHTLEASLNLAWEKSHKAQNRLQKVDPESGEGGEGILSSYRSSSLGMTFFEVLAFTPGMQALAADLTLEKTEIDVEQVDVKNDQGQRLQLIDHQLYYGVRGNDVVILQSQALRAQDLERHLNWLLTSTATYANGQLLRLSNRTPPAKESEIRKAKQISFFTEITPTKHEIGDGSSVMKPSGGRWEGIISFLKTLGPRMLDVANDIEVNGVTTPLPVQVGIFLKWENPKKNESHQMLDKIATGLRHVDEEINYSIETSTGSELTKDDFILRKPRSIRVRGGRPVRDLLHKSMFDWLEELKKTNEIA